MAAMMGKTMASMAGLLALTAGMFGGAGQPGNHTPVPAGTSVRAQPQQSGSRTAAVAPLALGQMVYAPAVVGTYSDGCGGRAPWIASCGRRLIRQVL